MNIFLNRTRRYLVKKKLHIIIVIEKLRELENRFNIFRPSTKFYLPPSIPRKEFSFCRNKKNAEIKHKDLLNPQNRASWMYSPSRKLIPNRAFLSSFLTRHWHSQLTQATAPWRERLRLKFECNCHFVSNVLTSTILTESHKSSLFSAVHFPEFFSYLYSLWKGEGGKERDVFCDSRVKWDTVHYYGRLLSSM